MSSRLVVCRRGSAAHPQKSRTRWLLALVPALLAMSGCSTRFGFLNPAGPVAGDQRDLFLWTLGLTLIVIIPVIAFTPWLVWRYRRSNARADYRPHWDSSVLFEVLAWGVPILVVTILSVLLWRNAYRLDPYRPLTGSHAPLRIDVVGLDWKWLFIYPDQRVASVNQLVVPVGRPVRLVITSDTVMQSLLIPRLAGQIYAMAGMRTQLNLRADQAGTYIGENTQYNGPGFARQKFTTLALPPAKFADWIERAKNSDATLDCAQYRQLTRQDVRDTPTTYAHVAASLFDRIVDTYRDNATSTCAAPRPGDKHD